MGCNAQEPSSPEPFVSLGSVLGPAANKSDLAPPLLFNTQMRSELESPVCVSDSKGHSHIAVQGDGTIQSDLAVNNRGGEVVRFSHIHHLNPGAATGPIIWWLTAPTGTNLQLTDANLRFRQAGDFVSNAHFTPHEEALAELLRDPASLYVTVHSNNCPGGFARGFLD
jgi:hypothetical protein